MVTPFAMAAVGPAGFTRASCYIVWHPLNHSTVPEEVGYDMHVRHGHMTLSCSRVHIRVHNNVICDGSW